jgi:hypothetical protein
MRDGERGEEEGEMESRGDGERGRWRERETARFLVGIRPFSRSLLLSVSLSLLLRSIYERMATNGAFH